ncbi:MAG: hydrogenase formation protein HypD [Acidobacteriota bacterium]|nr:hydrogenase formation protein HypD [Acidobacteriota bacterium]
MTRELRYIEGFRRSGAAEPLRGRIALLGKRLAERGRSVRLMEVCGSHTMAIGRYGLRDLLPENVELVSGPGCPVCVTDNGYIDAALELARREAVIVTFGDMMRVPGSAGNLAAARTAGARVEVGYSPEVALEIARREPAREVVFLAIGFETTVAPVVSLVAAAAEERLGNLSLLVAFKLVPPALEALIADPELRIDGFLCPAHVSAIIGSEAYRSIVDRHRLPCVVAGFEPLDILLGLAGLLEMLADDRPALANQYARVVRPGGNPRARALIERYLQPVDATWRGIGTIPASGLGLRSEWAAFDAARRFDVSISGGRVDPRCRCGEVLRGRIRPPECGLFATVCTPERPVGACMVFLRGKLRGLVPL